MAGHFIVAVLAGAMPGGAIQAPAVPPRALVVETTRRCVDAVSPQGIDAGGFGENAGWTEQRIAEAPDDRFFAKDGVRVSLGTRAGVGGSCIVSYRLPPGDDLAALTGELARAFSAPAVGGMLRLPGRIVMVRETPSPAGRYAMVDVEVLP